MNGVLAPAAVLFAIMVAHTVLETARDALFLARLGPDRLAAVYLAMAALALAAFAALRRWGGVRDPRRMLIVFVAIAAAGTGALALVIGGSPSMAFVLYVWTGLIVTLIVPSFWTLLDRSFRIGDAKRRFAAIGAGGVVGAVLGSALAGLIGRDVDARWLVAVGAGLYGIALVATLGLAPRSLDQPAPPPIQAPALARHSLRYVRMLVALGVVSMTALTIAELTFKRVIAAQVAPAHLASVLGAIYAALNAIGLAVQLALTPRLLARWGVGATLSVLPVLLVLAGTGFAASGALGAVLALELANGGLRHSVHNVGTELLYLPMPAETRDRWKPAADAIELRGGEALAALAVFAFGAAGAGPRVLGAAPAAIALAWLIGVARVRRTYVAQFRDMIHAGHIRRDVRMPALDADSIDLLVQSLSSPDEVEAVAALDLLASRGRVPALVLYHPSVRVVHRALALLEGELPRDFEHVLGHLLGHHDARVRAAALAAASRTGAHRAALVAALEDHDVDVRAVAMVQLVDDPQHAEAAADGIAALVGGTPADRHALAQAIEYAPPQRWRDVLAQLLARREPAVLHHVLVVLARAPELADLDQLLPLLADARVRGDVRDVFVAAGPRGLDRLVTALDDPATPAALRRHVPRTISRFRSPAAASALCARLAVERDGATAYKILRALGRMRADQPRLAIDEVALRAYVRRATEDATRYARMRAHLHAGAGGSSHGLALVLELLDEKRAEAIERAFRGLGVLDPDADMRSLHDALVGDDEMRRGAAREVVEASVAGELREPLLDALDGAFDAAAPAGVEDLIAELLADPSESLRCVVAHYVAARRLVALRGALERLRPGDSSEVVRHAFDQAIASLHA